MPFRGTPFWAMPEDIKGRARRKIAESRIAGKNWNWKGDDVGYFALHEWVKRRLPKPIFCECCGGEEPRDLASKSHAYIRDLGDWWWLCRSCHMVLDGRLERLHEARKNARKASMP